MRENNLRGYKKLKSRKSFQRWHLAFADYNMPCVWSKLKRGNLIFYQKLLTLRNMEKKFLRSHMYK